jgi:hypothetical protein
MNFGNWIVLAFVLFAIFIGTLVTVCVRQNIDLVSKNYYGEELKYQDQIRRINNTNQLVVKPLIVKVETNIAVRFDRQNRIQKGELTLFCPSNPKMDKTFSLSTVPSDIQFFDIRLLQSGMYKAKLLWMMNDKEYFLEKIIYI